MSWISAIEDVGRTAGHTAGTAVGRVAHASSAAGRVVGNPIAEGGRELARNISYIADRVDQCKRIPSSTRTKIQRTGRKTADLVHDAWLAASAGVWLVSEIPQVVHHSIFNSKEDEELYPYDVTNVHSMIKQAALSATAFITPIPWFWAVVGAFNGIQLLYTNPRPAKTYPLESWFFINGIATDRNWCTKNCLYLERRFGQPVTGIYNGTAGAPADLVTCVLNRNLQIPTKSVQDVVNAITYKLATKPKHHRIRIMAHSQGTLILNLALQQLSLTTTPADMSRLLIHTFASCAKDYPDHGYGIIEHYANEHDAVAKLGVLDTIYRPRYHGTVYVRPGATGHLLNTYYSLQAPDYQPVPHSNIHPDTLLALPAPPQPPAVSA